MKTEEQKSIHQLPSNPSSQHKNIPKIIRILSFMLEITSAWLKVVSRRFLAWSQLPWTQVETVTYLPLRRKWTETQPEEWSSSLPSSLPFPLESVQYVEIIARCSFQVYLCRWILFSWWFLWARASCLHCGPWFLVWEPLLVPAQFHFPSPWFGVTSGGALPSTTQHSDGVLRNAKFTIRKSSFEIGLSKPSPDSSVGSASKHYPG